MAIQNHFALFISRLIAPMAAKHGAQRRLNARKANPDAEGNKANHVEGAGVWLWVKMSEIGM